MRRFSHMEYVPVIIVPTDEYAFYRKMYADIEEMTDGKMVGFFNPLGYFIGCWK